jgi:hypothetical protein
MDDTDNVHLQAPLCRPDVMGSVVLKFRKPSGELEVKIYRLPVIELKSLSAATDEMFDAICALERPQRLEIIRSPVGKFLDSTGSKIDIELVSPPEEPATHAPRRSTRTTSEKRALAKAALLSAAVNLADVGGYTKEAQVTAGLWSPVIRHVPVLVNHTTKTIFFADSRGHRLRGTDPTTYQASVDPDPSFLFLRAALDIHILESSKHAHPPPRGYTAGAGRPRLR